MKKLGVFILLFVVLMLACGSVSPASGETIKQETEEIQEQGAHLFHQQQYKKLFGISSLEAPGMKKFLVIQCFAVYTDKFCKKQQIKDHHNH